MTTKLLIFGMTGDLSRRKLIPALERIAETGDYDDMEIIGVSRRQIDLSELLGESSLLERTRMVQMDLSSVDDYAMLRESLALQADDQVVVYLSVPPASSSEIVQLLGRAGLNDERVKLMIEKPFGTDLASAQEMSQHIAEWFKDEQVYRIDHYLAKSMAQNIVALRSQNALFAHVWDASSIEKIEVNAYEQIDIEGRAQFYEQTGALRDLIQGHLLQLLALTIMDIPADFSWKHASEHRARALQTLVPASPEQAVRAQYQGYREEVENELSTTETFASVKLESTDARWQGVPFYLTTGKALVQKLTEIKVFFKKVHVAQTNCLVFRIQPREGVEVALNTLRPGYEFAYDQTSLTYDYAANGNLPDAYEQVLVDAMRGDKHIFTSNSEVLRSWELVQPLLDAWSGSDVPLLQYQKGFSAADILHHHS